METEMNAKTLDDLVKIITREYPEFVVPDRGYRPIHVPMIEYSRDKDEYPFYKENINCKGKVFGVLDNRFRTSDSTFGHTTLGDLKSIIDEAIEKYGLDTEVKFDEHQCKAYDCGTTTYKVNVDILKKKYETNDEYYKRISDALNKYKEKLRKEKQLKKDIAELSLMLNTDTLHTANIENSDLYTLEKFLKKLKNEE